MSLHYLTVQMGGGLRVVQDLLNGLPGDHQADDAGDGQYCIASSNGKFLKFAIENQGYGTVIEMREVTLKVEGSE